MIGYLGPEGTFSHTAALNLFGGGQDLLKQFSTIYSLLLAVDQGKIEKAVVPIENSIEGSVNMTLDTLAFDTRLHITGEYILSVQQNILVKPGAKKEDIRTIVSIDQAIGQCSRILNHEFPDVKILYSDSTAGSARTAAQGDGSIAAIGSAQSAELYGLDILFANCSDDDHNATRFVIVEKDCIRTVSNHDRTSIAFIVDNKPGSLYNALELLAKSKVNMIKIESRPIKRELGEYVFFIDIDGNIDNPDIYFALDKLKNRTSFYKFLGSYPKYL